METKERLKKNGIQKYIKWIKKTKIKAPNNLIL